MEQKTIGTIDNPTEQLTPVVSESVMPDKGLRVDKESKTLPVQDWTTTDYKEGIDYIVDQFKIVFGGLSISDEKVRALAKLSKIGVDPHIYEVMLNNHHQRDLRSKYGLLFFVYSCVATAVSYVVVILNASLGWGLSDLVLSSLVIQTPIQILGLLFIIARSLFPRQMPTGKASSIASMVESTVRSHGPATPMS